VNGQGFGKCCKAAKEAPKSAISTAIYVSHWLTEQLRTKVIIRSQKVFFQTQLHEFNPHFFPL